jgi:hypothetical protein
MTTTRQRLAMATERPTRKLRWATLTGFVAALLALGLAFGLPLSNAQSAAILAAAVALGPLLSGLTGYVVTPAPEDVVEIVTEQERP